MKNINVVVSDLDGTLLKSDSTLSDYSKNILSKMKKKNITFIPATARGHKDLPKDLIESDVRYFVCANGAVIYDKEKDIVIESHLLEKTDFLEIIANLPLNDIYINIVNEGKVYTEQRLIDDFTSKNIFSLDLVNHFKSTRTILSSTYEYLKTLEKIEKLHFNFLSKEKRDEIYKMIPKSDTYQVSSSDDLNLEITNIKSDKGLSTLRLCEILNIDKPNIIGFGDNLNDAPLFEHSNISVAMKNGHKDLIKLAKYVSFEDNNNDGVTKFIEANIL